MTLLELTDARTLEAVESTSFADAGVYERADLQRALRERIDVLGEDLLVVSEEFGDFEQLVATFERQLRATGAAEQDGARETLAEWLDDGEETVVQRRVRIILVSAGFDTQITTTVLGLNALYGLDITCVRLRPYRLADRLVLDVQHVIPLPEAAS